MRGVQNLSCNVIFDCPDQRGLAPSRPKNRFNQEGGCTLSVGPCNPGIRNALGRTFVEICAQAGEGATSMHDLPPRDSGARHFGRGISDNRNRSRSDRLINEAIAVASLALHRDKSSPWTHPSGIVFYSSNARVPALGEDLGALQKLLECHWS